MSWRKPPDAFPHTQIAGERPSSGHWERAGYLIEDGQLRRTLPEALDLPVADDEVHSLLNRHDLITPLGHLDQAITAHGRSDWAAANGQSRSFLESLLDEAAYRLVQNPPQGQNQGEARREALANLPQPFLIVDLNEWGNQGKKPRQRRFQEASPPGRSSGPVGR